MSDKVKNNYFVQKFYRYLSKITQRKANVSNISETFFHLLSSPETIVKVHV